MPKKLTAIPDTADISDQTPEQSAEIIERLPPDRKRKPLNIRCRLQKGDYVDLNNITDFKVEDGLLRDAQK